jgi:hypothetical protein
LTKITNVRIKYRGHILVLLDRKYYNKVIKPLKLVTINNMFARSVAEQKAPGKIFVDNSDNPKTFYVLYSYGMSLLFGNWKNCEFNKRFIEYALNKNHIRDKYEWMQVFPDEWNDTLSNLLGDNLVKSADNTKETGVVELNSRVNFRFSYEKYLNRTKKEIKNVKIVKTDANIFLNMPGVVVPKYYWHNETDFLKNGIGFSLLYDNQLAATAFSSWVHDNKLEIGIETVEEFRRQGFAEIICEAIIEYCIVNKYEPVWSCRMENTGSYILAQKMGFEPIYKIPYYRLSR